MCQSCGVSVLNCKLCTAVALSPKSGSFGCGRICVFEREPFNHDVYPIPQGLFKNEKLTRRVVADIRVGVLESRIKNQVECLLGVVFFCENDVLCCL